jgi:hypothetical protein
MNGIEVVEGKCNMCGKRAQLTRKYYHYDIKCECHSPKHFEIVWHCKNCTPKPPEKMTITMEPSLDWKAVAEFLYAVLDDIDTASDHVKGNDAEYRRKVTRLQKYRHEVGNSPDGYKMDWNNPESEYGLTRLFGGPEAGRLCLHCKEMLSDEAFSSEVATMCKGCMQGNKREACGDGVPDPDGVHLRHCSIDHGCKYNDDDCPVSTGRRQMKKFSEAQDE